MDIVLDTPVVVLPRGPCSPQVLVAHLGKITISNSPDGEDHMNNWGVVVRKERYNIEMRDMNLYSLDTELRANSCLLLVPMRAEKLYSCAKDGKPILHDTMIQLVLERNMVCQSDSVSSLLLGEDAGAELHETEQHDVLHISGSVVTPLKVSLSRQQYEQLLDSIDNLLSSPSPSAMTSERRLEGISEEVDGGMTSLEMDQGLRAKLLHLGTTKHKGESQSRLTLKETRLIWTCVTVVFQLPVFTVELRSDLGHGEQGLVDLSFQDFCVQYDKSHSYETNIEMSLRALLMEDLLREPDSKHRCIVVSSATTKTAAPRPVVRAPEFVSKSCPNLIGHPPLSNLRGSLPDHLETEVVYGTFNTGRTRHVGKTVEYPCTPPPSPRPTGSPQHLSKEDNLVHINVTLIDRDAPNLASHYNSVHRSVTVNFNSLDVVVNVESWVVVLDFFGIGSSGRSSEDRIHSIQQTSSAIEKSTENEIVFNSEMDVEVCSLTLVLNHPEYEVARANISHLTVRVNTHHSDQSIEGRLGSMSLMDLTHHGQLYREKFISSGLEALNFTMIRNTRPNLESSPPFDSHLKIEMSSVLYVHTSRFVAEIQEFFHSFSRLQDVVESIRAATAGNDAPVENTRKSRLLLELTASSPVILLPVSSQSLDILVVDLGNLSLNNSFKEAGSVGTIIHSQMCDDMETEQDGETYKILETGDLEELCV
ncbi:unnamed protein product [Timema podura]|uniref:VPS13-like middle region domain-containing protein n=1 Tax=Timema podura TaxID=61482 RepID=A0ABN7P3N0_TIMPD|nr:unnamed protein product [Timema podura]